MSDQLDSPASGSSDDAPLNAFGERDMSVPQPSPHEPLPAAAAATSTAAEDDDDTCRVCRGDGTPDHPLFHPCKCKGSIKYVHQDCLQEWLTQRARTYCELCHHPFQFSVYVCTFFPMPSARSRDPPADALCDYVVACPELSLTRSSARLHVRLHDSFVECTAITAHMRQIVLISYQPARYCVG
jgi:hypothetical protein